MLTNDELHEHICMDGLPSCLTDDDKRQLGDQVIDQAMQGDSPELILRAVFQFIYDRGGQREVIEFIDACEALKFTCPNRPQTFNDDKAQRADKHQQHAHSQGLAIG